MHRQLFLPCVLLSLPLTAVGQDAAPVRPPEMTKLGKDLPPFKYIDAKIPFYPGQKGGKQAPAQMQLPVDPAESMKHMVHPVDFELKLVAADPHIKRPICMNWDERGRLWIAESVDYPNERGQNRDRIVICEDTDGDGVMDKFTVWADKLSIPTGFTFYKDGIIVLQAPHTLFLRDTKGAGVSDKREILFTGWGTGDTHAGPSNLHYGFDNWIYGVVGYSGFRGTVGGEQHTFNQGFYRFKPDGSKLEFLRSTNNNTWGLGFSEDGLLLGSTANGNPSVYMPIANRYYEKVRGLATSVAPSSAGNPLFHPITDKVRQVDYHGRFTAAAGHALYTARTYPKEYWNQAAFVCEPTGHLVATFMLKREGAEIKARNAWNLLASNDEWCAPIMAEVGPDGNVWIIDWYNYIVQHNPTPPGFKTGKGNAYETALRDKKHGRIYKLVMKNAKPAPAFSLKDATPEVLVAALNHDNLLWRKHAQRLLVERGKLDVIPVLVKIIADPTVDRIGLNAWAIHGLWTLSGLGAMDRKNEPVIEAVARALKHPSSGVRRAAALVLPQLLQGEESGVRARLVFYVRESRLLEGDDVHARLAGLLALADIALEKDGFSLPEAGKLLVEALRDPRNLDDPFVRQALTMAANTHGVSFLEQVLKSKNIENSGAFDVIRLVAEEYSRSGPIGFLQPILRLMSEGQPKVTEAVLYGLAKGWPKNRPGNLDEQTEKTLVDVIPKLSPAAKANLIKLTTAMGSKLMEHHAKEITQVLLSAVTDEKRADEPRLAAAKQIIELQPGEAALVDKLLGSIKPRSSPQFTAGILDALGGSQSAAVGPALVKRIGTLTPQARAAALRVLLSRPPSTRAFLDAVENGKMQFAELTLEQKQALAAHPDNAIAKRAKAILAKGGGLPSPDRQKVLDQFMPLTKQTGDPAQGKLVFKKFCAACHTHSGEGAKIGPDLTGMAVHPKDHLLTDILDPNRSVEGNYRVYIVTTQDGKVLNGLLASESKTAIELFDAEGKKHVLQRDDIDQLIATPKSLMPDGFEKQLTEKELVNLLEFLTQRGKFLPLSLAKVASAVSTKGMFYSEDAKAERLIFPDYAPRTFEGVPFHLVDPQGEKTPNVILMYSPNGTIPPKMPKTVTLPCNTSAKAIHLLSGVSGWGFPIGTKGSVSLIVRLHYADGKKEDHSLKNGEHFADYIRRVDVPGSKFAYALRGQQIRYVAVLPGRAEAIERIELIKGPDATAPIVMAVTVESR